MKAKSASRSPANERRAAGVRMVVLDVDGVMTDGRLYFGAEGEALKVFDVRDGHGVSLLRHAGIAVAILSARSSPMVARRAEELDIAPVFQGERDKLAGFHRLLARTGVRAEDCAYMGDDWPDLPVLAEAGFATTVADAAAQVKRAAHWIAPAEGGRGAVRALAEYVLRCRHRHPALAVHAPGAHG